MRPPHCISSHDFAVSLHDDSEPRYYSSLSRDLEIETVRGPGAVTEASSKEKHIMGKQKD